MADRDRTGVAYLIGLLGPFGFLALLAPEILLLSLPLLLANLLSAYPAQYYGEFHYSAPVVAYVAAAAAYGAGRLWRALARRTAHVRQLSAPARGRRRDHGRRVCRHQSRTALRPLLTWLLIAWIVAWAGAKLSRPRAGRWPHATTPHPSPRTIGCCRASWTNCRATQRSPRPRPCIPT
ncbi:MAG: DUF2079 domain-containing protein [Caldilineaceae bacterium]